MSDGTKIEWSDSTWPVVTGCTHLSEGCDNCYAAKLTSGRLRHLPTYTGLAENGKFNGTVRLLPERLEWPLHWRKPRKVFVSDMADLFHEAVPSEFIARVFAVMATCQEHIFQVLTKRHARMRSLLSGEWGTGVFADQVEEAMAEFTHASLDTWPLPNVWLGVSAEDQKWADIRIPALLDTPAAVRFVSAEPLLGPIDLSWVAGIDALEKDWTGSAAGGTGAPHPLLDWIIAGGESGPGARTCELGWIEEIVNACHAAGTPVFVKQLGAVLGRQFGAGAKGGDIAHWPPYLQHRQFPRIHEAVTA